jgi:large subunit ribosomal protein L25
VQRHPLKGNIEHVDLLLVRRGEKVVVDVRIVVVGEAAAETLVNLENPTVSVEAEATHIPERIEVSIEGAEAGTQIHAEDLVLPPGSTLVADEDLLVVNVTMAPTAEELEAEGAGEVEEAAEVAPEVAEEGAAPTAAPVAPAEEMPSEQN